MSGIHEALLEARRQDPEVFPPGRAGNWREAADAAVDGVLLFYGRRPVRIGRKDIDWSGSHVAHQEWPAQLNRFVQLDPLRRAYGETRDEKYAQAARDYIEDWLDRHAPYPVDSPDPPAPGETTLNMSCRLGGLQQVGWLGAVADLMGSEAFDEDFAERIVASIAWQLDWLAGNLPQQGNWRIAALDCLFSQAIRLPGRLSRHLAAAVEGLNVEFARQILDDGVHLERSAGYHDWMCNVFVRLWRLSKRRGDLGISLADGRVARMHSYTLHHTKPNAASCGFNDATAVFRTGQGAGRKLSEALRDHKALLAEAGEDADVPTLGLFASAGQVFYRTGWGTDDLWWAFDAAGWGGGHTHLSRLSLEMHNGGRTTLPDPGIFDYEMSNPFAPAGKSTAAHSTMNVNLGNQADVDARLLRVADMPAAVVAQGRYEGAYWPGAFGWRFARGRGKGWFGAHDRTVVWLKDRAMVVLDCLTHEGGEAAYLHWVSDDVSIDLDADALGMTTRDERGNVCIRVCPISAGEVSAGVRRGEEDPYLGWVAPGLEVQPAPLMQVCFRAAPGVEMPTAFTECATVIVPFTGGEIPRFTVSARPAGPLAREVRIDWADGASDRVIYTRGLAYPIRQVEQVRTDGTLALIVREGGGGDQVSAIGASFVKLDGQDVAFQRPASAVSGRGC